MHAGCCVFGCVFVLIESEGGGWRQGEDNVVGEGDGEKLRGCGDKCGLDGGGGLNE